MQNQREGFEDDDLTSKGCGSVVDDRTNHGSQASEAGGAKPRYKSSLINVLDRRARVKADTLTIVYGEAAHAVKEQEEYTYREKRQPQRKETIVKSIKGPSVTAGVFFDVLDSKSKQPTQPQAHEVDALYLKVDPDAEDADAAGEDEL